MRAAAESNRSPPLVSQALVAAAARILTPDSFINPRQLIRVDGAPVIIHLLRGLQASGIKRVVITLGHAAHILAAEVRNHHFGAMVVEFVWCEQSSWKRGHASNILAARSMFPPGEPFLLVMSDHLFDQNLLRRCCLTNVQPGHAAVLIDDSQAMADWAAPGGPHCQAHCKHGHCNTLVKVVKADKAHNPTDRRAPRVSRIGKRLSAFDGLEAGAYVVYTDVFDVLHRLLVESIYCTLAEAMQVFAEEGRLSWISTQDLDWFSELTVASLHVPLPSVAVHPEWRARATEMLRVTSPHLVPASGPFCSGTNDCVPVPLYSLGNTIGEGGTSVVLSGARGGRSGGGGSGGSDFSSRGGGGGGAGGGVGGLGASMLSGGSSGSSHSASPMMSRASSTGSFSAGLRSDRRGELAVKVIRKGASESAEGSERLVMWEVHVLQQLHHDHIVRVMDVIEVVDASYIIMQRVEGPELTEYLALHPERRLEAEEACTLFGQLCSALRHAHHYGFLHCDMKPDNIRLTKPCDHAVVTDWGYARTPGERSEGFFCGTPAYASPEQLTGCHPDSVTGRRKLCPATDVWSLGVTLFEMLSGRLPFRAQDHSDLVRLVLGTKYTVPEHVPLPVSGLVQSMLALAPSDRATIDELCNSPLLQGSVPADPSLQSRPDRSLLLACGACDEEGGSGGRGKLADSSGMGRFLRSALPPWVRRFLWMLLYASLCGAAIWSHLTAPTGEELRHQPAKPAFELADD